MVFSLGEDVKILLCNGAHIGDLILTTTLLRPLQELYPRAHIGCLVHPLSAVVVEEHVAVHAIHPFTHPQLDRSFLSRRDKKRVGSRSWRHALESVRAVGYDIAIDLYYFYPSHCGALLQKAEIPCRVCFWSCRGHFHFTDRLFWDHLGLHMVENHQKLLEALGVPSQRAAAARPDLSYHTLPSLPAGLPTKDYLVIHIGCGERRREWGVASWRALTHAMRTWGLPLVFIGQGPRTRKHLQEVLYGMPDCLNLCDQLAWKALIPLVQQARGVIGLESMVGHIAAALDIPAFLLYSDSKQVATWRPYNPCCQVITPSASSSGREEMAHLRVEVVWQALQEWKKQWL